MEEAFKYQKAMKLNMRLQVRMTKTVEEFDGRTYEKEEMNTFSTSKAKRIIKSTYKQIVDEFLEELLTEIHETEQKESAWKVARLNYINLDKIRAARGSSWIPTPERYSDPKCGLINITNEDQECFRWCMKCHQSSQQKDAQDI